MMKIEKNQDITCLEGEILLNPAEAGRYLDVLNCNAKVKELHHQLEAAKAEYTEAVKAFLIGSLLEDA